MHMSRYIVAPFVFVAALAVPAAAMATPVVWDQVAACESGGNWSVNTGNGYYGGIQFDSVTWAGYGGHAYAPQADLASKAQQVLVAQRVLAAQGPNAWPVCGPRAGLTRVNGRVRGVTVSRTGARRPIPAPLVVDGIMGPLTRAAMGREHVVMRTPAQVRAWQHRLRVRVDGVIGWRTTVAVQRWLNTH